MANHQTAPATEDSADSAVLYVAFELSKAKWKLGFGDGSRRPARVVTVDAPDLEAVGRQVQKAKQHFGLREDVAVRSCYEAGRDGFWLHRALTVQGIDNLVVDPASIEVNRRYRRVKTDRVDAIKLLEQLVRYHRGERRVWAVVRVPSAQDEDARQLHRELATLRKERAQHRMRIQSLLFAQGVRTRVGRGFLIDLGQMRGWNGKALPEALLARIHREHERLVQTESQIRVLEQERRRLLASSSATNVEKAKRLVQLRGIGVESAWLFSMELFGWRQFANRRQLAGAVGLTPTPYASGDSERQQGVSKVGNKRVRTLLVEIAWAWLRFQPDSALSQWFNERFAAGGARLRRIGIVALARRLLIALWRFVEDGVVPDGARLKTL